MRGVLGGNGFSRSAPFVALLILVGLTLSPVLHSGFISDDARLSITRGFQLEQNKGSVEYILSFARNAFFYNGRFLPFTPLLIAFHFIADLLLYKLSIIISVLASIACYWYLTYLLTDSLGFSLLSIASLPLLFQFRLFHDPILSFGWLMEGTFLYTCLSLVFLCQYLRTMAPWRFALSIIMYCMAICSYEITYSFVILHLLVIIEVKRPSIRDTAGILAPYVVSLVVCAALSLALRCVYGGEYGGVKPSLNSGLALITLMKQVTAALPLSYYFTDPQRAFATAAAADGMVPHQMVLFSVGYLWLFVCLRSLVRDERVSRPFGPSILLVAFALWFLISPGLVMSLSAKYQSQVRWGTGYLPVYMSYFGLSLLVAIMSWSAVIAWSKSTRPSFVLVALVLAIGCGALGATNYHNNSLVVAKTNEAFLYPRSLIEEALHRGLMQGVPDGSRLVVDSDYDLDVVQSGWNYYRWDIPAFYLMHSGVHFAEMLAKGPVVEPAGPVSPSTGNTLSKAVGRGGCGYYLKYSSHAPTSGFVIFGKIEQCTGRNDEVSAIMSNTRIYVYVRHSRDSRLRVGVEGMFIDGTGQESRRRFAAQDDSLDLIRGGTSWALYALRADEVDVRSLRVVTADGQSASNG